MTTKKSKFQLQAEEVAIPTLTRLYQLYTIAEYRNNQKGLEMYENDIVRFLHAWEVIGLDTEHIETEAERLANNYESEEN